MYWFYQYLSIDPKKMFATPTLTPIDRPQTSKNRKYVGRPQTSKNRKYGPQTAHKLQKIVNMMDISETRKTENWDFRFR